MLVWPIQLLPLQHLRLCGCGLITDEAVAFFSVNLPSEDIKTIDTCLEMVRFGMSHILVQFGGRYFEVGGEESSWD